MSAAVAILARENARMRLKLQEIKDYASNRVDGGYGEDGTQGNDWSDVVHQCTFGLTGWWY